MQQVSVTVHEVKPDGFRFSRTLLSRGGDDEFSSIKLCVKTETGDAEFVFYVDTKHENPVTVHFGDDVLVVSGRK